MMRRTIAALEVVLIFPAALFMTALFVRNLQPQPAQPAHAAQQIVMWYASLRGVGLWLLLITMPLAVLATGCATLASIWRRDEQLRVAARQTFAAVRAHFATLLVAIATIGAAAILAAVALHVMTD